MPKPIHKQCGRKNPVLATKAIELLPGLNEVSKKHALQFRITVGHVNLGPKVLRISKDSL